MNASQRLLEYIQDPKGSYAYFDIDVDYLHFISNKRNFDMIEDRIKFCESIGNPCVINFGDISGYIPEIFLVPPFELLYWTKKQDLFLLYFDYPEAYMKAMDKIIDQRVSTYYWSFRFMFMAGYAASKSKGNPGFV